MLAKLPAHHHRKDRFTLIEKLQAISDVAGPEMAKEVAKEYSTKYFYLSHSLTKEDPIRFARLKANEYIDNMLHLVLNKRDE